MNNNEFFTELDLKCPKNLDKDNYDKQTIDEWIIRENLTDESLSILMIGIKENHPFKTYPGLPDVIKIWHKVKPKNELEETSFTAFMRDEKSRWYDEYSTQEIVDLMIQIKKTGLRNVKDIALAFYAEFEQLLSEYYSLKSTGMPQSEMFDKLVYIKDCLHKGFYFKKYFIEQMKVVDVESEERKNFPEKFSKVAEKFKNAELF